MSLDPAASIPLTPEARAAEATGELRRGLRAQQSSRPFVQVGAGAPTRPATELREGTPYADRNGTGRLYIVLAGTAGDPSTHVWRSVALG